MVRVKGNSSNPPAYSIEFYATPAGNEPVDKWLNELSVEDRRIVRTAIDILRDEWPSTVIATRMPSTGGLCEINRAGKLSGNRSFRLFFFVAGAANAVR